MAAPSGSIAPPATPLPEEARAKADESASAATSRPGTPAVQITPAPTAPSYVPSLSWRGFELFLGYTIALEALGAGIGATYFELDRASIARNHPVGTCHASQLNKPALCDRLANHIESRDVFAKIAVPMAILTTMWWGMIIYGDYRWLNAPAVAPAATKDGASLMLLGVW